MNKVELISKIAEQTGSTKKATTELVDVVFGTIADTVASGEDVKVSGFGTFTVAERAARDGRNPATGETLHIEASKAPKFKAASAFKTAVKEA